MKPTELRLRNWIKFGDNITEVDISILNYIDDTGGDDGVEPIPLTEEWLKKFGFKKDMVNGIIPRYRKWLYSTKNPVYLQVYFNFFKDKHFDGNVEICPRFSGSIYQFKCQYVHQLQNLYFALTGKELEIKHYG